jgi:hypothetical protein
LSWGAVSGVSAAKEIIGAANDPDTIKVNSKTVIIVFFIAGLLVFSKGKSGGFLILDGNKKKGLIFV